MTTNETTTINEYIIENHRLTKQQLCIHQDDVMGCHDRMVRPNAILNSRTFEIPDNLCKLHIKAHNNIQFKNQINQTMSDIHTKL